MMAKLESELTLTGMTLRNLYRQPVRTILTAVGVAVGTSAIVAFGSISRGMWASSAASLRYGEGEIVLMQRGVSSDLFSTIEEESTRAALLKDPAVERVAPALWQIMSIWPTPFCLVMGLESEEIERHADRIIRGRLPQEEGEVLIGSAAARIMNVDVNRQIYFANQTSLIVGVFETDVIFFNSAVVVPLPRLQELSGKTGVVTNFQVKLKPGSNARKVAHRLTEALPKTTAHLLADQIKRVDRGPETINAFVGVIAFLSIAIGSVIVMNTMWMSVHERTREIGVLRAVGWARQRIVGMILCEAVGVGLLAWMFGVGMGFALAKLATRLPFARQIVDPVFDVQPVVVALVVAILLSAIGAAAPAWRAARISPVEALRYE